MSKLLFGLLVLAVGLLAYWSNRKHSQSLAAKEDQIDEEEERAEILDATEELMVIQAANNKREAKLTKKAKTV